MRLEIVVRNSARCLDCGEEIESKYGHRFVTCRCGQVSVDGGLEYRRRAFKQHGRWTDTSILGDQPPSESDLKASKTLLWLVSRGCHISDRLWEAAPVLSDWREVPARAPTAEGQVEIDAKIAGDPWWPFGQHIRTTPVLFRQPDVWVRTTSRFFRLGTRATT